MYPNPGFPIYESMINFVGRDAVPCRSSRRTTFGFDLGRARAARHAEDEAPHHQLAGATRRAACSTRSDVGRIADAGRGTTVSRCCRTRSTAGSSTTGESRRSRRFPGMKPQTVILDGFSKTYAMTGWRLGYGVMPKPLRRAPHAPDDEQRRPARRPSSSTAGVAALRGAAGRRCRRWWRSSAAGATCIVDGLNAIPGVTCLRPAAPSTSSPTSKALGRRSKELADQLLDEAGVAVLSGTAFGEHGEGYLRLSYAASRETIARGAPAHRARAASSAEPGIMAARG